MKKFASVFGIAVLIATFAASVAYAQSSGNYNFAYSGKNTQCTDTSGLLGTGATQTALKTGLKVSSGSGVGLIVRPSAVVGLLTDVTVTSKNSSSFAEAGVNFSVKVTPLSGQAPPDVTPATSQWITYDERYISISTNLFQAISTQCTAIGGCFFTFDETTLSAHSFDWVVDNLSSGDYEIEVDWAPYSGAQAPSTAQTCVGPLMLTAEQVKGFTPSTGISY